MTNVVRCAIALIVVIGYVWMSVSGRIGVEGYGPIVMYVVKKFMDSLKEEKQ